MSYSDHNSFIIESASSTRHTDYNKGLEEILKHLRARNKIVLQVLLVSRPCLKLYPNGLETPVDLAIVNYAPIDKARIEITSTTKNALAKSNGCPRRRIKIIFK